MRQTNTKKNKRQKRALKFKFKVNDCKQFQKVMARLSRKQQQDKRELLSSLNHMNNCNSKHAAENRKFVFFSSQDYSFDSMFSKENNLPGNLRYFIGQLALFGGILIDFMLCSFVRLRQYSSYR